MVLDINLKYDFDAATNLGIIQPSTFNIVSTGASVFFFGSAASRFTPSSLATDTSSTFGGDLDTVYNTNVIGSGKTVALRIEDSSTNPTFTLDTAILEFRQNDRQ
jgi:hypothetical protein